MVGPGALFGERGPARDVEAEVGRPPQRQREGDRDEPAGGRGQELLAAEGAREEARAVGDGRFLRRLRLLLAAAPAAADASSSPPHGGDEDLILFDRARVGVVAAV